MQIYSLNVLKVKLLKWISVLLLEVGILTRCLWVLGLLFKKEIKAYQIAKRQGHFLRSKAMGQIRMHGSRAAGHRLTIFTGPGCRLESLYM